MKITITCFPNKHFKPLSHFCCVIKKVIGIEPIHSDYDTNILPLNYTLIEESGIEPPFLDHESNDLPLIYSSIKLLEVRIELTALWLTAIRSTIELLEKKKLIGVKGFEPMMMVSKTIALPLGYTLLYIMTLKK